MAGHTRTTGTGATVRGATGKPRRVREHLPAGDAEIARRKKAHAGARSQARSHIATAQDGLRQIEAARDYVRSAAAKYHPHPDDLQPVVQALLAAGDRIFEAGTPRSRRKGR